jgi:hypothetical protein
MAANTVTRDLDYQILGVTAKDERALQIGSQRCDGIDSRGTNAR